MELKAERIKIGEGINLNLINIDKFKSNLLSLYFLIPLNREDITKNALLPLVLKRGTKELNTNLRIQTKLEEMYGADFSVSVNKKGERLVIRFTIEGPREDFVKDKGYIFEMINFIKSMVYDPYLEDGIFSNQYLEQEKEILIRLIEGKINEKRDYAIIRCIEEMCKNEKFSIYPLGYVEDLNSIDSKILYNQYTIIKLSPPRCSPQKVQYPNGYLGNSFN